MNKQTARRKGGRLTWNHYCVALGIHACAYNSLLARVWYSLLEIRTTNRGSISCVFFVSDDESKHNHPRARAHTHTHMGICATIVLCVCVLPSPFPSCDAFRRRCAASHLNGHLLLIPMAVNS